jgi:uncharacterized protein YneF (UPF0154 family)
MFTLVICQQVLASSDDKPNIWTCSADKTLHLGICRSVTFIVMCFVGFFLKSWKTSHGLSDNAVLNEAQMLHLSAEDAQMLHLSAEDAQMLPLSAEDDQM